MQAAQVRGGSPEAVICFDERVDERSDDAQIGIEATSAPDPRSVA
jgi:hypothetical protein